MRNSALLAVVVVALTLTGCQPTDPVVVPQPEPSSTPLFASEEEALAAAEEAFAAYLAVLDGISAGGGVAADRLSEVATEEVVVRESAGLKEMAEHGERTVGSRMVDSVSLQSFDATSVEATVTIYACQDFSALDVVDQSGASVLASGRQTRYPLVVTFSERGSSLVVAGVDDWTGADFCVR